MTYAPTLRHIALSQLLVGSDHVIDWGYVEALAEGTMIDRRPIDVEPVDLDHYRIVHGHHRFAAALVAGNHEIACKVHL